MLSFRTIFVAFALSCIFFLVVLMPLPLIVSLAAGDRIQYKSLGGSLLEMNFGGLILDGNYVGQVTYKPRLLSLFTDDVAGAVRFSKGEQQGAFEFKIMRGDNVAVENLLVITPVDLTTEVGNIKGAVRIKSESAVVSMSDGCRAGEFSISTNAFDQLSELFGIAPPLVIGQAVCSENGMIDIELTGNTRELSLVIQGRAASNQNWNAPDIELTAQINPPSSEPFSREVIQLFEATGLSASGQGYSLPLTWGSLGN